MFSVFNLASVPPSAPVCIQRKIVCTSRTAGAVQWLFAVVTNADTLPFHPSPNLCQLLRLLLCQPVRASGERQHVLLVPQVQGEVRAPLTHALSDLPRQRQDVRGEAQRRVVRPASQALQV